MGGMNVEQDFLTEVKTHIEDCGIISRSTYLTASAKLSETVSLPDLPIARKRRRSGIEAARNKLSMWSARRLSQRISIRLSAFNMPSWSTNLTFQHGQLERNLRMREVFTLFDEGEVYFCAWLSQNEREYLTSAPGRLSLRDWLSTLEVNA